MRACDTALPNQIGIYLKVRAAPHRSRAAITLHLRAAAAAAHTPAPHAASATVPLADLSRLCRPQVCGWVLP